MRKRVSDYPQSLRAPMVIATLAYPEAKYAGERTDIARKLSFREYAESKGPTDWLPGPNGIAIPVDTRKATSGSKQLELRLRRRMELGRLVLMPILAAERGQLLLRTWGGRWKPSPIMACRPASPVRNIARPVLIGKALRQQLERAVDARRFVVRSSRSGNEPGGRTSHATLSGRV